MNKTLFLLCPTDCLETAVNDAYENENYFYTSLGNSFAADNSTLKSIKELILKHDIKNIYFVLSNDNKIILDALERQSFSEIIGLENFYSEIIKQKEDSEIMWLTTNNKDLIISYFLNHKIKELQLELGNLSLNSIKVRGKIYDINNTYFKNIYSSLICLKSHCLN
ncbi:hypothetical protein [uncultured Kordia sp.]|uniref:hypothetical protein n=1 Tax=uncultured Kordia sp. TaxID=507699 RepID=UPI00260A85B6|nr:hypothetical protein [uncultured Kordia sp.]